VRTRVMFIWPYFQTLRLIISPKKKIQNNKRQPKSDVAWFMTLIRNEAY